MTEEKHHPDAVVNAAYQERRVTIEKFREVLKERIDNHRGAIKERARWIKEKEPRGEQRTGAAMKDYMARMRRWKETIDVEYAKLDEAKVIAHRAGIKLDD